ncbi:MAG: DUF2784 domain-containing protein [Gammaproteobacteria bacterium]|nr:DUF2784 domain-containing protein [Gammaproteobacteria bacterium]
MFYRIAADAILVTHVLFVAFVVFGLALVLVGAALHWQWIRNFWFRSLHLAAIGIVVLQSWLDRICPLTTWEMELRNRAGQTTYSDTFVSYWLQKLLFYEAPAWVFIVCYTLFGILVVASWLLIPPEHRGNSSS